MIVKPGLVDLDYVTEILETWRSGGSLELVSNISLSCIAREIKAIQDYKDGIAVHRMNLLSMLQIVPVLEPENGVRLVAMGLAVEVQEGTTRTFTLTDKGEDTRKLLLEWDQCRREGANYIDASTIESKILK